MYPENDIQLDFFATQYRDRLVEDFHRIQEADLLLARVSHYLETNNITSVVIGVSGGIDSAVALAVLTEIQETTMPLLLIYAEVITFDTFDGVFSEEYIEILQNAYKNVVWSVYDMSDAYWHMMHVMGGYNPKSVEANITYAMRYNALFARAQQVGGITIGTTNADELDYVGWFGKNSDMVVDVQFLWRYPKCLIRELAKVFEVPQQIIDRTPTGDLIDNSSDEDNFGVTYDELRWYIDMGGDHEFYRADSNQQNYVKNKFKKVEELREKNLHKYNYKQLTHFNPIFL